MRVPLFNDVALFFSLVTDASCTTTAGAVPLMIHFFTHFPYFLHLCSTRLAFSSLLLTWVLHCGPPNCRYNQVKKSISCRFTGTLFRRMTIDASDKMNTRPSNRWKNEFGSSPSLFGVSNTTAKRTDPGCQAQTVLD